MFNRFRIQPRGGIGGSSSDLKRIGAKTPTARSSQNTKTRKLDEHERGWREAFKALTFLKADG
jgi:hypothetical protein